MTHLMKKKLPLILLFSTLFVVVYGLLELYQEARVNEILDEQEKYLEISYKQGIDRFETIAQNIYITMQNDTKLINLVAGVNQKNLKKRHDEIYEYFKSEYDKLTYSGIFGIQVVSPENISIVRMHAKERYGDSLAAIRPMMVETNIQKMYMHGFEEGKTSHAFREVFPLYKDGKYIGAMEVLFSSTKLQDYTMRASDIHTHFLVNKNVFKTNEWKGNIVEPYKESVEHKDFLFSTNNHFEEQRVKVCQKEIIDPLREEIDEGLKTDKSFHLYKIVNNNARVLVFLAIQRFSDKKTVAYLVSYTDVKKLYTFIQTMNVLKVFLLIIIFMAYVLVTRLLHEKESVLNELKYDALTGVNTRKYFMEIAQKEIKQLEEKEEPFCLVMADIDYFKNVNDTYGHPYGDQVLQDFSAILKDSIRSVDMVARYGGEEFIILLHTDIINASKVIEKLRVKVEEFSFGEKEIKLSSSFGITESKSEEDIDLLALISRADRALYKAKENGRNQIQVI